MTVAGILCVTVMMVATWSVIAVQTTTNIVSLVIHTGILNKNEGGENRVDSIFAEIKILNILQITVL